MRRALTIGLAILPASIATAWALAASHPADAQAKPAQAKSAQAKSAKLQPAKAQAAQVTPAAVPQPAISVVDQYCVGCHNAKARIGGIAFDTLDRNAMGHDAATWEEAIRRLRGHYMPPATAKQPSEAERQALIAYLETHLDQAAAAAPADPGRVPLHRLNRREYANSIRDLIALDIDPAQWLPQDPVKGDFDTDAASLQVTPNFLDQAVAAARALSLEAIGDPKAQPVDTTYGNIANMVISLPQRPTQGAGNQEKYQDGMPFGTRGGMVEEHVFPADGEYVLTIGDLALAREVPKMEFENTVIALLDGKEFFRTNVGGEADHKLIDQKLDDGVSAVNGRLRNIHFQATAGQHKVAITFLRRSYAESDERVRPNTIDGGQQRVEAVYAFQIKGPTKVTGVSDSPSRKKIFICKPESADEEEPCARKILANLAERAFRRPVTDAEMRPLMAFYAKGRKAGTFDIGVRDALAAILASPRFLYRAEAASDHVRGLSDLELASRLSFFLWSSIPDKELLTLAETNQLSRPGVVEAQVHRMLRDPKAKALITGFAFQWLNVPKLDTISPSQARFSYAAGVYDPRPLFKKELELYLDSILRSDRSVVDLLTDDHTYINEQIALLYGIEDIKGGGFRKVVLKDPKRRGLLGKGAVLMLTANPNRTAPVIRGAWILERILGTPPGNPPLNVNSLSDNLTTKPTTVRGLMELHRKNPTCAMCHAVMEPVGFALENFDTVGEYHAFDPQSHLPIDTAAVMPDGTKLNGPEDLGKVLATHGDQFAKTIATELMAYAVGRPLEAHDMPTVRRITRDAAAKNYTFESLVLGVVKSDAFRKRAAAQQPVLVTAQAAPASTSN